MSLSRHVIEESISWLKGLSTEKALVKIDLPTNEVDQFDLLVEGQLVIWPDLQVVEIVHDLQVVE